MKCPFCASTDTQVIDSRASDEGASIRRRRRCLGCDKRFTTYERVELALPSIVKRGGSRAEYDRDKLRASMLLALRKRPVPREAVDDAIGRIEDKLLSTAQREVKSEKLGELVMRELKRLDKVAYIRFASVYRSFEDVDEFAEVVKEVRPSRRRARTGS
ncbi:MAG: transcriptional repressor NrdR [Burkholderiaceae bacterium]|nr:transcriptional repressor NrdR [Burkholderiaceae bacterium]